MAGYGWMDGRFAILRPFNSISVISGRWEVERISPRAGIQLGQHITHCATWALRVAGYHAVLCYALILDVFIFGSFNVEPNIKIEVGETRPRGYKTFLCSSMKISRNSAFCRLR